MNVTGPTPIVNIQRTEDAVIAMRVNQRFSAEVLQVAGDRVVLSIDGVRVVARMVAADQSAALSDRQTAQFVVKDASTSTMVLQLVHPAHQQTPAGGYVEQELIPNLLRNAGLPVDVAFTTIARSLLNNGFQVTPGLVLEMQKALEQLGAWNSTQAQAAAALLSLGLPISPATMSLIQGNFPAINELLTSLRNQLRALQRNRSSPQLSEAVQKALEILDGLFLTLGDSGPDMAENLRQVIGRMGHSLEKDLAELPMGDLNALKAAAGDRSLLALALLRREFGSNAPKPLVEKLDQFLDAMRLMQFLNADPKFEPVKGQWLRLDLPILPGGSLADSGSLFQTARLRVAYHGQNEAAAIDSENTRFIVRVDLEVGDFAGEVIQVDVSVAGRRIGAVVTASSEMLRQRAEGAIPAFQESLKNLGYQIQVTRCEVADVVNTAKVDSPDTWTAFSEVSVEI